MPSWKKKAPPPMATAPSEDTSKMKNRSGFTRAWRLWRLCCCRYGGYPLIVAVFVTIGCILSLVSAAGCDFVRLEVGFTPTNDSWNESTAELGLFHYQSGEPEANKYREIFMDGCRLYSDEFDEEFVQSDRTWNVARIMAYISGIASMVAALTAWLFVATPLPVFFFWPGVLLPTLLASFLAEGSKFLFFDTSICRNTVWFPSGENSMPRIADNCSLGNTGKYAIASGSVFFVALFLVCLKAPEKRELDEHYGARLEPEEDAENPSANRGEQPDTEGGKNAVFFEGGKDHKKQYSPTTQYTESGEDLPSEEEDPRLHSRAPSGEYSEAASDAVSETIYGISNELSVVDERSKRLDRTLDKYLPSLKDEDDEDDTDDDKYDPIIKPNNTAVVLDKVSQSRLHAAERLSLNASESGEDIIEQFVKELNVSFQKEEKEDEKKNQTKESEENETDLRFDALCSPTMCGPNMNQSTYH